MKIILIIGFIGCAVLLALLCWAIVAGARRDE